jgi:hypothetical protein
VLALQALDACLIALGHHWDLLPDEHRLATYESLLGFSEVRIAAQALPCGRFVPTSPPQPGQPASAREVNKNSTHEHKREHKRKEQRAAISARAAKSSKEQQRAK